MNSLIGLTNNENHKIEIIEEPSGMFTIKLYERGEVVYEHSGMDKNQHFKEKLNFQVRFDKYLNIV